MIKFIPYRTPHEYLHVHLSACHDCHHDITVLELEIPLVWSSMQWSFACICAADSAPKITHTTFRVVCTHDGYDVYQERTLQSPSAAKVSDFVRVLRIFSSDFS